MAVMVEEQDEVEHKVLEVLFRKGNPGGALQGGSGVNAGGGGGYYGGGGGQTISGCCADGAGGGGSSLYWWCN